MLGFVCAVVAGFAAKYIDEPLTQPLLRAVQGKIEVEAGELRLVSFILAMLIAGVVAELLHSGSTFWLILGGALGYFATRLVAMVKAAIDGRGSA
jgi:hypothetical protein